MNSKIKTACEQNEISETVFVNALNGVELETLSDDEIEQHAKWCADHRDEIGA